MKFDSLRTTAAWMICAVAVLVSANAAVARPAAPQEKAAGGSPQSLEQGRKLFHDRCGYCHLPGGSGTIMLAQRLGKDRALLESRTDLNPEYIRKVTRVGFNSMPPHSRIEIPDSELDSVVAYLTRPASARPPSDSQPQKPASNGGGRE
ncbi:MAG TPA: cytochrome c [Candidatus Acidoferrales bacterium]|nr:cytochrome c [Candidatus Acidoferrales bacterium]